MRVVVIPKYDEAIASLAMAKTQLSRTARSTQLKELKKARTSSSVKNFAKETITAAQDHGAKLEPDTKSPLPVTGALIMETGQDSLAQLKADLPLHYVVPDYPLPLIPPVKSGRSNITVSAKLDLWHLAAIKLTQARAQGFKGDGEGITVGILDTGIAKVAEIKGRVERAIKLNTANGTWKEVPTIDTEGHGTHVAGLVAGAKVGVAPAAKLINGIMIPGGRGHLSDFILALEYVAQANDIAIMNMSAGIPGHLPEMRPAIAALKALGVLSIVATGNEGKNKSRSPGNYSEVVSVGASTVASAVASFSCGGQMRVDDMTYPIPDLVAPGEGVYSCVADGGYEAWDGTSMATPIVSGIAALILQQHPSIHIADLEETLQATCTTLGAPVERQGAGLAQVPQSLWHRVA